MEEETSSSGWHGRSYFLLIPHIHSFPTSDRIVGMVTILFYFFLQSNKTKAPTTKGFGTWGIRAGLQHNVELLPALEILASTFLLNKFKLTDGLSSGRIFFFFFNQQGFFFFFFNNPQAPVWLPLFWESFPVSFQLKTCSPYPASQGFYLCLCCTLTLLVTQYCVHLTVADSLTLMYAECVLLRSKLTFPIVLCVSFPYSPPDLVPYLLR